MSLKKLNINRNIIKEAITNYDSELSIKVVDKKSFLQFEISKNAEMVNKLNIYYIKDGKTTVSWQECKNPEESGKLANHIAEYCKFTNIQNTSIYIREFSKENLSSLLEFVRDFCGSEIINEKNLPNGKQYTLQSIFGDTVHINHFANSAFNVQGKSGLMKSQVIEGLSSYLTFGELVEATLEKVDIEDLNKKEIEKLYDARFPIASQQMGDIVKSIILPIFLTERLNLQELELPDYSFLVFPILRGLEGCIKEIFNNFGINIANNIGGQFPDNSGTEEYKLIEKHKNQINNEVVVEALELMYKYHRNNRHGIFHVDDTIISTKLINDLSVAHSLINETAELIEKCYAAIKSNDKRLLQ
jgi:hypothetical protein